MTDLVQLKAYVTPEQSAAIAAACAIAGINQSDFIRQALQRHCQQFGVSFPDNIKPRGNYSPASRRQKKQSG